MYFWSVLGIKGDDRIGQPKLCKKIRNRFVRLNLYVNEQEDEEDWFHV